MGTEQRRNQWEKIYCEPRLVVVVVVVLVAAGTVAAGADAPKHNLCLRSGQAGDSLNEPSSTEKTQGHFKATFPIPI